MSLQQDSALLVPVDDILDDGRLRTLAAACVGILRVLLSLRDEQYAKGFGYARNEAVCYSLQDS